MFSFLAGIGLSEYIRRRRLSLAAIDLKDKDLRIIDVAVKYGYNSADSFSRAFHSLHGILPSEARSENTQLKAYPRMAFQLSPSWNFFLMVHFTLLDVDLASS